MTQRRDEIATQQNKSKGAQAAEFGLASRAMTSWEAAIADWTTWLRAAKRAPDTIYLRARHITALSRALRDIPPYAATEDDLLGYLSSRQDDWAARTHRGNRSSIRVFYRWAHRTGRITSDPSFDLPSVKEPRGVPRPVPDEIVIDAMTTARDPRVMLMLMLGALGGLRRGEICKVHTRDLERTGLESWSLRILGKGNKMRVVPIEDPTLARLLRTCQPGFLFPGQIDGHLSAAYVGKLCGRALEGERWTTHTLRHRAGTTWLESSGGNIRVVQELLGHDSLTSTQIYTLVTDERRRSAVASAGLFHRGDPSAIAA